MNTEAKSATDRNGTKVRVGDIVCCFSIYDGSRLNSIVIKKITRQGYDGTILHSDTPPNDEFPHHFSQIAKYTEKAK